MRIKYLKQSTDHLSKIIVVSIVVIVSVSSAGILSNHYVLQQSISQDAKNQANIIKTAAEVIIGKEFKKKAPVYIELPGVDSIQALVDDYQSPSSLWVLANKQNALPSDYIPDGLILANVSARTDKSVSERSVRPELDKPLQNMFADAKKDGVDLMIGSAYRSYQLQSLYFNSLASQIGETAANISVAYPGQSEHQTGLAVDISSISRQCYLDECFDSTLSGLWLLKNSYKYGFTLRYPKGKEEVTGYRYEPWHYRYVGVDLSTALYKSGLTLEEAWPIIENARQTLIDNGAIKD